MVKSQKDARKSHLRKEVIDYLSTHPGSSASAITGALSNDHGMKNHGLTPRMLGFVIPRLCGDVVETRIENGRRVYSLRDSNADPIDEPTEKPVREQPERIASNEEGKNLPSISTRLVYPEIKPTQSYEDTGSFGATLEEKTYLLVTYELQKDDRFESDDAFLGALASFLEEVFTYDEQSQLGYATRLMNANLLDNEGHVTSMGEIYVDDLLDDRKIQALDGYIQESRKQYFEEA